MSMFQRIKQSMLGTPRWAVERIQAAKEKRATTLDLSGVSGLEKLTKFPEEILELSALTSLNLSGNQINSLPVSIQPLHNLKELDLSGNQLSDLFKAFALFGDLHSLDLSRNQFSTMRNDLPFYSTNLRSLDLSGNQLSSLPAPILAMEGLTSLKLRGNRLSALPESIDALKNLTTLDLSVNALHALPESFPRLQNLRALYVGNNPLYGFPAAILRLPNLTDLDLSGAHLNRLPEAITQLQQLSYLNVRSNLLNQIPTWINRLQNLEALFWGANELSSLPEAIFDLENLTRLDLRDNQLSALPESVARLQELTALWLGDNKLTSLPEAVAGLPNLFRLDLDGNPLIRPPLEIAVLGIEAIRQYFHQLGDEGVDYLYEAKLLILGEGGAGKTTLAKKLLDENYTLRAEKSTTGVDVLKWTFRLEGVEGDRQFTANLWDFGGQEIYHATHQFFLTRRSLYALVADTRKEDTDFYYWLNVAELLSDNSPLLIIKNEKEDRHREIPELQLKGEFKSLKDVLGTNLATNRGLGDVREAIEYYLKKLPHIGSPLPRTWVRVRGQLEGDPRNHISFDEYLSICRENGFEKPTDALQLSGYLHDIGVFLHFQDEPLLKKTVILKPKWGTDAVYKVLDNKTVIKKLGQFTREDLDSIWDAPAYETMRDELLGLMMKFKLCYEIPPQTRTYIAPQLLTDNQPKYEWDEKDNLLLRYSYEFMPKGILTQFIVVMHPYIQEQKTVWKSGVVIEKERTRAEVIEYYSKREIRVRIAGPNGTDLMAIIRHELKQIHDAYKQLHYNELVPCNCSTCKNDQDPHFYRFEQLQNFAEKGILNVQCGRSGEMVDVRRLIKEGLNEEDTKDVRKTMSPEPVTRPEKAKRNGIFISYAREDKNWLEKVRRHLKVLENMGIAVNPWDDTRIKPGMKWREEIEKALASAKVAVLLISTDFLSSDFISRDEIPALLKAAQEDGATILPLILNDSLYTDYPNLKEYQAVNDPSKPLSTLRKSEQEEILVALSRRIKELMQSGS